MEIESTTFGTITIDGKTYEHDVVIRLSGEVVKAEEEAVKEVLRHLTRALERRSEVCLREGVRADNPWLGSGGQCPAITGSGGLFREKGLQGPIAADARGNPCVQQVACKEDWAFSRDLLKRTSAAHKCVAVDIQIIRPEGPCADRPERPDWNSERCGPPKPLPVGRPRLPKGISRPPLAPRSSAPSEVSD